MWIGVKYYKILIKKWERIEFPQTSQYGETVVVLAQLVNNVGVIVI